MPDPPRQFRLGRFTLEGTLLQTRVGRRILGLFVLCALLPVTAISAALYVNVSRALEEEARQRVRNVSRRLGLALHDHLQGLAGALEAAAARAVGPGPVRLDPRFSAMALRTNETVVTPLYGPAPALPTLTQRQRDQLHGGGPLLVVGTPAGPLMAQAADQRVPPRDVLWGVISLDALAPIFTELETGREASACALLPDGQPVYCGREYQAGGGPFGAALGQEATGTFEWASEHRFIAGFWSLFLDNSFAAPDIRVIYSEAAPAVLAPLAQFRRTVSLTALLSLLVVGLLSTVQIRRSLRPLEALRAGTERVARGDFDRPVAIDSRDEFEDLASAFNDMTGSLKDQFAQRERLHNSLQQLSDELRTSEARLRAIFESAADSIVTVEESGLIESFNRTAEHTFGWPREQVTGRSLSVLFLTPLGEGPGGLPASSAVVGSPTIQVAARRRDGSTFPAELAISAAQTPGRVLHTVLVRDITERKRAAEERERLEAQLRHAQKLETVGTLAGGIAHDFNNILTPIIGFVEVAMTEVPSGSQVLSDLNEVFQAAQRASQLVRQILLFSRRSEQVLTTAPITPVVKEALKLLRASLPSTIEIRPRIDPHVAPVRGDLSQLHQVLMNLCTNASHAMRERGGLLDVALEMATVPPDLAAVHPRLQGGPAVRLSVRDTGHGMDSATQERLFEPFFTTKPAGQGTGLGLSIVHGIVTSHDGAITVESSPGVGTRFEIYLPPAQPEEPQAPKTAPAPRIASGHVLVVDDDPAIVHLVARILERAGCTVTKAASAHEALELAVAAGSGVEVLLTDQTMPGMTGTVLAREIRKRRPTLPIILMTGYSALASSEELNAQGIGQLLLKPLDGEVLVAAIARALHSSRGTAGQPHG